MSSSYNPYTLPRLSRQVFTKEFESPAAPGKFLHLSLYKMDGPDNSKCAARWMDSHAMYVTGKHELCLDDKPLPFPGLELDEVDRLREVELESGGILQNAASLEMMQPEADRHAMEFFVVMCFRDDDMWNQVNKFALEVNTGKAKSPKDPEENPEDLLVTSSSSIESPSHLAVTQN